MPRACRVAAWTLAVLPGAASAHSPIEGIGHFYGGLLHPLLVLSHALCLLLFALLVGQQGVRAMRHGYPAFLLAMAVGLVMAGWSIVPGMPAQALLLGLGATCGLLVTLQWRLPTIGIGVLGAAVGLVMGLDSGVDGLSRQETFAALLGCWLGAALALILVAGLAELLQRPWQRIALRVVGSWGVASAALVLALALR